MERMGITYHTLHFLLDYEDELTTKGGVYFWIYYPKIDPESSTNEIIKTLEEYSEKNLRYHERFRGDYKFEGTITERGFPPGSNLFGLGNAKAREFRSYLDSSKENRIEFIQIFEELCFSRPFYVGKANNICSRIKSHISGGGSTILKTLADQKISYTHVWIGYRILEDKMSPSINNIVEEIFNRILKPGLTVKPN